MDAAAAEREVRALEDRRVKAMMEDDLATLAELMHDELIYTHANALVDTKASYLASLAGGAVKYVHVARDDIRMRVHGDAVFVAGRSQVKVRIDGQEKAIQLRYSNVWMRTPGGWKFAFWHATPAP